MDAALKQRLLGAAVLIALAVIFVPMLLNGPEHKDGAAVDLAIPPPPERQFETRVMPVDDTAVASSVAPPASAVPDTVVAVDAESTKPVAVEPEIGANPALDATAKTPAQDVPPETPKASNEASTTQPVPSIASATGGRFFVGLGSYAAAGNAEALVAAMKQAGLPAYAEATTAEGKAAQRVRLGPFADRAAAERARLLAKGVRADVAASVQEMTEQAQVDDPIGAVAAGKPGAWAVQVGAFKAEGDANKLREQLRGSGFVAFVERIGAGDETLFRVRVGPEVERNNAERIRASVKTKFNIDGLVVAHP